MAVAPILRTNVLLVGFMGAGKSTVGKLLAQRLGYRFEDIDTLIEEGTGLTVNEIFDGHGEPFFRDQETAMLHKLESSVDSVISTGGGIVLRDENWVVMKKMGTVVALLASPEAIYRRVKDMTHRPLLKVPSPFDEIVRLLNARMPFYRKADLIIDTDPLSPVQVVEKILSHIR